MNARERQPIPATVVESIRIYGLAERDVNAKRRRGIRASFDRHGLDESKFDEYRDAYESACEHKREDRDEAYRNALTRSVR